MYGDAVQAGAAGGGAGDIGRSYKQKSREFPAFLFMSQRLVIGPHDLADIEGIEAGRHIGLYDPPFDDIADGHDGGEGKHEYILHGVLYELISFLIDLVYEAHAFCHHFKIVFDSHPLGVVGEGLDGLIDRGFLSVDGGLEFPA
jgi:hypothetical protein